MDSEAGAMGSSDEIFDYGEVEEEGAGTGLVADVEKRNLVEAFAPTDDAYF